MLNQLRQTAQAVAHLICVALLATWVTGAHAHRHVGGLGHEHTLHAGDDLPPLHEPDHSHERIDAHAAVPDLGIAEHDQHEHVAAHSVALIHDDGHENIELQALQPPSGKVLPDLPLLALLCCAVLVLARTRTPMVAVITDPPDPERSPWSLRPPLRGPPSFSVV